MKKLYTTIVLLFGIMIYAQDGTLDPTFGTAGIVTIPGLGFPTSAETLDYGKIICAGKKLVLGNYVSMLFKLNLDGTLDTTFSGDGIVTVNTPNSEFISVHELFIGGIFAGQKTAVGATTTERIYKFTSNGDLDLTFGSGNGYITAGALFTFDPYGNIISAYDEGGDFIVQKFDSTGAVDPVFNSGLSKHIVVDTSFDVTCKSISTDYYSVNGAIIVTGHNLIGEVKTYKFNVDGTSQSSFAAITDSTIKYAASLEIAEGPTSFVTTKNYASPQNNMGVAKYINSIGALDTTFGTGGIVKINFNNNPLNVAYATINQPDNKIIVVGKTGTGSSGSFALARLNTNGTFDTTFGTAGKTITPSNSEPDFPAVLAPSPDGKLFVIGQSNTTTIGPTGSVQIAKYRTGIVLKANDFITKNKLTISPNPTNSTLNIQTQEPIKSINLIDILGRKNNITNFENNKIDVNNLQNGVYFLEIATRNGTQVEKFIKN
jgi:uncharacterized delta-60 repeat protein